MSRPPAQFCLPLVAVVFLLNVGLAHGQIAIQRLTPWAVRPGEVTELTLHGTKLEGALKLWTSFPAEIEAMPPAAGGAAATFRVKLAADVAPGIGGVAVANETGLSNVMLLAIDDLPSVADSGQNQAIETAQPIEMPLAIDGVSDGPRFDYYKFSAKAGQRIAAEVLAARFGSKMDPVLTLLDAQGKTLAVFDDDDSFGPDPRFVYTFAADGDCVLRIHDNKYAAGGHYRLRMGDFPLVSTPFPLGATVGQAARLAFAGPAADDALPLDFTVGSPTPNGRLSVAAKRDQGRSSGFAMLIASDLGEVSEAEPNEALEQATAVTLPTGINGRFAAPGDRDYFRFTAKQGTPLWFRAVTRSAGSPTMLRLRLQKADGSPLAETKVTEADEETLAYTIPADGDYLLLADDLLRRGGPAFAYRIEARSGPHVTLAIKADKNSRTQFVMTAGDGAAAIDVQCQRFGYDGPIELTLGGEPNGPTGFRLFNAVIPASANETRLIVAAGPNSAAGSLPACYLAGKANLAGRDAILPVGTAALNKLQAPELPQVPPFLDGLLLSTVVAAADPIYELQPAATEVTLSPDTGEATLETTLVRKNAEFKTPVTIVAAGLPAGFSLAVKAEADKYTLTFRSPKDAAAGTFPVELIAYGEHAGRGRIGMKMISLVKK